VTDKITGSISGLLITCRQLYKYICPWVGILSHKVSMPFDLKGMLNSASITVSLITVKLFVLVETAPNRQIEVFEVIRENCVF
jgi:hypothetical protein